MTVAVKVLGVKVSIIPLYCVFKDPAREECHHLGEDIFAFVHNLRLVTATNLAKRSLQIVKCQRAS